MDTAARVKKPLLSVDGDWGGRLLGEEMGMKVYKGGRGLYVYLSPGGGVEAEKKQVVIRRLFSAASGWMDWFEGGLIS